MLNRKSPAWLFWLILVITFGSLIVAIGCGGGSSTAGPLGGPGFTAVGKVTLPVGFRVPLAQLQVVTDSGAFNVNANGSFSAPVHSNGPRMVHLVDKLSGKIALLGYVDAASSGSVFSAGQGDVSPKSTADALLFMGLMGATLPASSWSAFLGDIRGSAQETQVAAAVTTSVKANPTAISDGDLPISNAVRAVQITFTGPKPARAMANTRFARANAELSGHGISMQKVIVVRRAQAGALVKVEPAGPQSGLIVQPNPKGDGIVPVSTSRRRGAIFIYKVGVGPSNNQITRLNPPQTTFSDIEIEPTEAIEGVGTGIAEGLQGKFAYQPLTNAPIVLQPDAVEEVAVYNVVAIGPGATDTIAQIEQAVAPNNPESRAEYDKEWRAALLSSQLKVLFDDIIRPVISEMLVGVLEENLLPTDSALDGILETAAHHAPGFAAALASRDLKGAATAIMTALEHNSNGVRTDMIAALSKTLVSKGKIDAAAFQAGLREAASAIEIVGVINEGITVVDVAHTLEDNDSYSTADVWTADVLQPVIKLTPQKSFVDTNDPLVHMAVTIQNVPDLSDFRFQWSNTASEGKLEKSNSTNDLGTGIIPDSTAVYVTDFTKFQVGGTDTITVKVFDKNDVSTPIGTATAVINGAPAPCTTKPPAMTQFGALPPTIVFSEQETRPGDVFTVTVAWPADAGRQLLDVILFSAPGDFTAEANRHESCVLTTVDGAPAKSDVKEIRFTTTFPNSVEYHIKDAQVAQSHTLVFKMLEPTTNNGDPIPYCSADKNSRPVPPYVDATSFGSGSGGTAIRFFNENP